MKYISPGCSVNSSISSGRLVTSSNRSRTASSASPIGRPAAASPASDIGTDIARRDLPLDMGIDRNSIWRVGQVARLPLAAPGESIAAIEALEGFGIFLQHHVMDSDGAGEPRYAAQFRVPQTSQPN